MTTIQLNLLLAYIDAKIAEHSAQNDWDGGLHVAVQVIDLRGELEATCDDGP